MKTSIEGGARIKRTKRNDIGRKSNKLRSCPAYYFQERRGTKLKSSFEKIQKDSKI